MSPLAIDRLTARRAKRALGQRRRPLFFFKIWLGLLWRLWRKEKCALVFSLGACCRRARELSLSALRCLCLSQGPCLFSKQEKNRNRGNALAHVGRSRHNLGIRAKRDCLTPLAGIFFSVMGGRHPLIAHAGNTKEEKQKRRSHQNTGDRDCGRTGTQPKIFALLSKEKKTVANFSIDERTLGPDLALYRGEAPVRTGPPLSRDRWVIRLGFFWVIKRRRQCSRRLRPAPLFLFTLSFFLLWAAVARSWRPAARHGQGGEII